MANIHSHINTLKDNKKSHVVMNFGILKDIQNKTTVDRLKQNLNLIVTLKEKSISVWY